MKGSACALPGKWWEEQYAPRRARCRMTFGFFGFFLWFSLERASSSLSEEEDEESLYLAGSRGAVTSGMTAGASGAMYLACSPISSAQLLLRARTYLDQNLPSQLLR